MILADAIKPVHFDPEPIFVGPEAGLDRSGAGREAERRRDRRGDPRRGARLCQRQAAAGRRRRNPRRAGGAEGRAQAGEARAALRAAAPAARRQAAEADRRRQGEGAAREPAAYPRPLTRASAHDGVKNALVSPGCGQSDAASDRQNSSEPRWFGSAPRSVYFAPQPPSGVRALKLPRRLADRQAPSSPIRLFFCPAR